MAKHKASEVTAEAVAAFSSMSDDQRKKVIAGMVKVSESLSRVKGAVYDLGTTMVEFNNTLREYMDENDDDEGDGARV